MCMHRVNVYMPYDPDIGSSYKTDGEGAAKRWINVLFPRIDLILPSPALRHPSSAVTSLPSHGILPINE